MLKKLTYKLWSNERGTAITLVAIGMTAILGLAAMVVDIGRLAAARQSLVNAVDAAAMAGAREFALNPGADPYTRESAARQQTLVCAQSNSIAASDLTMEIVNNKVSVDATRNVNYVFAPVLGLKSGQAAAHAAASAGALTSYTGVAPLCIREQPFELGTLYTIKFGSPDSPGNFGALALGGRGARTYRDNLINGFQEPVHQGEVLDTETGNMNGPTDGINERLNRCTDGCTYDNFKPACHRILIIPLHREDNLQGRDTITVTGFAAFFIDRSSNCASDEIKGYFVRMAGEGEIDVNTPPTTLYGVKLVE
jgi:Flp pilus assembly protein TadG